MMNGTENDVDPSSQLFDQLITAVTCKSILSTFHDLCDCLGITNTDHRNFYKQMKTKLTSWKAKSLWTKLDKRASHRDYRKMEACPNTKVLIIGAGPCGLRMAIEVALMGAKAVVVEKRDRFSRNNVLHLWNFVIADLRNLGAKKFFGKFCAGSIEHISIRQLQCILLKVALLLGVEVHVNVTFEELIEPPEDQSTSMGWRCRLTPSSHPVSEYQFDVLIGADGKRNTVPGFQRKEFRGKLAIAITANFINRNTNAEARVEEISGVAFIFNQKFFLDLKEKTGIDLENIVYYKDETHYFVMTAKKASLLEKGVLKEDYSDTTQLLSRDNVDQEALLSYAKEAANFSTNHQLPNMEYAVNHYGQADIAMFDFTSMFAAENACRAIERHGHRLFIGIAGDSLLEPFWPTGSGCARGFLGVFDAAWMIKSMASGKLTPLQVIAERESIYQLLSQTTPENLHKNHNQYSIDPNTRYPNLNFKNRLKPIQVKHLFDGPITDLLIEEAVDDIPAKRARNMGPTINNDLIDSYSLLRWCQRVLNSGRFRNVHVVDFAGSWRNGLAFCALIHAFRPTLLDFNLLMESDVAKNNQLAFDVAEKELGVPPVMTGEDMAKSQIPDKLTLVSYISQLYAIFRNEPLPTVCDANWEFCEKMGYYIRVEGEEEDRPIPAFSEEENPFSRACRSSGESFPPKCKLNYEKLPDWVKYAASQASASEDSEATDSDGTTADGSITVWQTAEPRESWSDSSDSTDDEVYAPVSVQSLKRLYEGPRGYTVSAHRPKQEAVKKSQMTVDTGFTQNIPNSQSEKETASDSVTIDDSHFKTLTQEDVENFNSGLIQVMHEEDKFKTLTQEDVDYFNSGEHAQQGEDDFKTLTPEDVANVNTEITHPQDEELKTLTQEDVENVNTEIKHPQDEELKPLSQKDVENVNTEIKHPQEEELKTLTQEDVENGNSEQEKTTQSDKDKFTVLTQNVKTFNAEEMAGQIEGEGVLKGQTQDVVMVEEEADVESSDDETFVPQDVNALTKKWAKLSGLDKSEREKPLTMTKQNKRKASRQSVEGNLSQTDANRKTSEDAEQIQEKSVERRDDKSKFKVDLSMHDARKDLSVKSVTKKQRRKYGSTKSVERYASKSQSETSAPIYRDSASRVMVMLPGIAPNNESSTDDAGQVPEPGKLDTSVQELKTKPEESTETEGKIEYNTKSSSDAVVDSDAINFKAAKRKFQNLDREKKSASKKVDRRSSFRSPKYAHHRSYIDIMKDNHPSMASIMSIDHGEERESVDNQGESQIVTGNTAEAQGDSGKCLPDSAQAETESAKLPLKMESEYSESRVINLGKTFSHLETASSTDTDFLDHQPLMSKLPPVAKMDTSESQIDINEKEPVTPTADISENNSVALKSKDQTEMQESGDGNSSSSDEDDTAFHDAEEYLSVNITNEAEYSKGSDIDDSVYQTAYESLQKDSNLTSNSADQGVITTIDEKMFETAAGSQLASRLQLVSVSEDTNIREDQDVSSPAKPASVSEDLNKSKKQKVSSKTCSVI